MTVTAEKFPKSGQTKGQLNVLLCLEQGCYLYKRRSNKLTVCGCLCWLGFVLSGNAFVPVAFCRCNPCAVLTRWAGPVAGPHCQGHIVHINADIGASSTDMSFVFQWWRAVHKMCLRYSKYCAHKESILLIVFIWTARVEHWLKLIPVNDRWVVYRIVRFN